MADNDNIDYNTLKEAYAAATFGHDEPDVGCCTGSAAKFLSAHHNNFELTHDAEGNLIDDERWYWITKDGFIPVREQ